MCAERHGARRDANLKKGTGGNRRVHARGACEDVRDVIESTVDGASREALPTGVELAFGAEVAARCPRWRHGGGALIVARGVDEVRHEMKSRNNNLLATAQCLVGR